MALYFSGTEDTFLYTEDILDVAGSAHSLISLSELLNCYILPCYITVHKCLWMLQAIFCSRIEFPSKWELNRRVGCLMQTLSTTWACFSSCEPTRIFAWCLHRDIWQFETEMGVRDVFLLSAASADGDLRTVADGPGSSAKSQP